MKKNYTQKIIICKFIFHIKKFIIIYTNINIKILLYYYYHPNVKVDFISKNI